ncbi:MAG: hypothetical protein IJ363_08605 [Clostridia bacterium]|nr:hypothetical protein [Clostridia bacterium]
MKKVLTMFLIILLCVSAFSGCDNVLPQNGGSQTTDDTLNTNAECAHNWILVSSSEEKYECAECKETHLCVNAEDLVKAGHLNESTLIYKCRICGSEHLTTDPNSINPDNEINDHVPYDSMLNLEIIDGKFRFQRIATTPCIVYSNSPITDMSNGTMYDDRHDILTAIFRATDGKDAIMDTTECEFLHYIYMFDNEREDVPWHYRFAICSCGAVMITNNNQFLCTIKISDDEIQTILDSFGINQGNPENHNWQVTSQTSDCWSITVNYACSKCGMEKFTHEDSALPYHSWAEKTDEGKTTFSCIRCNESYTFLSEIRTFSYAQALEEYKIGDPGVKHEHFNNWNVESEITGAIDAIVRAKFELTIEYDTISVSYDEISNMWRVDFWTLDLDGNSQSVYINGNGLTCYIVYGE